VSFKTLNAITVLNTNQLLLLAVKPYSTN